MTVLVLGTFAGGTLRPVTTEVAAAGRHAATSLGVPFVGALLGCDPRGPEAAAFAGCGFDRVIVAPDRHLALDVDECFVGAAAAVIATIDPAPSLVLLGHSIDNGQRAARLAARIGAGLVTDCIGYEVTGDVMLFRRPTYGGIAAADVEVLTRPALATLRAHVFKAEEARGAAPIETIDPTAVACRARITLAERVPDEAPLEEASVVVAGGRGLGGPANWHLVEEAADALGAVVGASRAATDAGWVPSSRQIGLTGASVAPDLYVALGISGAPEHMAGIANARTIVAVNKDPDATIFHYARYGVVADLREVVPAFVRRLAELRASR